MSDDAATMREQWIAEAERTLASRGNITDRLVFERAGRFSVSSTEETFASASGMIRKRSRHSMRADREVADELSLILSYRLGMTPSFWGNAAHAKAAAEVAK